MLPQNDTLSTIAEIGIAVTGFAGIVAALRHLPQGGNQANDWSSLRDLVGVSLGVVFFSFVPEWVHAATSRSDVVWQVSNGLYGSFRILYLTFLVGPIIHNREHLRERRGHAWMAPTGFMIATVQLAAAAGFFSEFHYFVYLTALLWGLGIAVFHFMRLLIGVEVDRAA